MQLQLSCNTPTLLTTRLNCRSAHAQTLKYDSCGTDYNSDKSGFSILPSPSVTSCVFSGSEIQQTTNYYYIYGRLY